MSSHYHYLREARTAFQRGVLCFLGGSVWAVAATIAFLSRWPYMTMFFSVCVTLLWFAAAVCANDFRINNERARLTRPRRCDYL